SDSSRRAGISPSSPANPNSEGGRSGLRDPSFEHQRLVPIVTPLTEQFGRVRQLVVDLQVVAVGIVKIDALLTHVVDGAYDRHAMFLEGEVGVLQRLVARDLER